MTNAKKKLQKLTEDSRRASLEAAVEAALLKFCRDGGSSRLTADHIVSAVERVLVLGEDPPELSPWDYLTPGWRYRGPVLGDHKGSGVTEETPVLALTPNVRPQRPVRPSRPAPPQPDFVPPPRPSAE